MARDEDTTRAPLAIIIFAVVLVSGGALALGWTSATPPPEEARAEEAPSEPAPEAEPPPPEVRRPPPVEARRPPPAPVPPRPEAIPAPPDVAAPPADAQRTPSGLASKVLQAGTGDRHPSATDTVRVHYTGWRSEDGEMFDSSVARGAPLAFPLNRVIAGWTEGVQLMVVGEKRRFWIPANLAYEGNPRGPQGMLVFDVELLAIQGQE